MIDIILNEKEYVEKALELKTLGAKPVETINRVARYYYSVGYKKERVGCLVERFLLRCDSTINLIKWQDVIDRAVRGCDKYSLVNIQGVGITRSELRKISELEGRMLQRLAFTMLCLAKFGNAVNPRNSNWVNHKDKDIFYLANIQVATKKQSLMINDLWVRGYVKYSKIINNINLNITFINNGSTEELFIDDFRNLGNQYMKYIGDKYIECEYCGLVVKEGHGKQKYCTVCAAEINRQKTGERYQNRISS